MITPLVTASAFVNSEYKYPKGGTARGPAQATFLASKLSVRVVLAGHTCFTIILQNYRSDLQFNFSYSNF